MRNVALRLRYDGSAYHGWQRQAGLPTVQQTVEEAVEKVCGVKAHVTGCGRTDAGVHALSYCANFRAECTIPADRVPLALNARLPGDISVTA
ncbi:MAG: tRNA pseudouridine(38-40) synthase TruA, partial [Oscillospiraceae bacterium]|nr:tRNA pseudouridine(38-40) synthase TruA [Oscillospiraceae bacterium]